MDARKLLYADDLIRELLKNPDNEHLRVVIEHDGDLYQITSVRKGYAIPIKNWAFNEVDKEENGAIEVIIID